MQPTSPDAMYQASVAVLTAAARVADERSLPPADVLREQMIGLLRDFVARCRAAGVHDVEAAEARYALVAFIDDRILKSNWPGRAEWQSGPLQMQFFREFTAGENFYARMRALLQRGGPPFPLEAYYLCLALGFVGAQQSIGGPQAVRDYLGRARSVLLQGASAGRVAPNVVPSERHNARPRPFPMALAATVTCAVVALLALAGLDYSLGRVLSRTAAHLVAAKAHDVPAAPGGPTPPGGQ